MSYLDRTTDPRRRGIAIAGAAAIQALLAYAIVTGLAVQFFPRAFVGPTRGIEIPLPPPPPPTPTPQPKQTATPKGPTAPPMPFPIPPSPRPTVAPFQPGPTPVPIPAYTPPVQPTPSLAFKARAATPKNDPTTWVNEGDYPPRDENEGNEGTTVFRVTVNADGRVSGCAVVRSSGHPALDAAACRAVTSRARFAPATDDSGERVIGSYTNSVRWQIPR
ncbi:MAG TPA: TonB family protein [Croceibacterium sp.]|jgi:protein TonB